MTKQDRVLWGCLVVAVGLSALGKWLGGTGQTICNVTAFFLVALFLCKRSFWDHWEGNSFFPPSLIYLISFGGLGSGLAWYCDWMGLKVACGLVLTGVAFIFTLFLGVTGILFIKDLVLWLIGSRSSLEFGRSFREEFPPPVVRESTPELRPVTRVVATCSMCGLENQMGARCSSCGSWLEPGTPVATQVSVAPPPPAEEHHKSRFEIIDE